MPQLTISYNFEELYAGLMDLARNQVPYALSRTLNNAAVVFQRGEQKVISENFILRHAQFILNGVWWSHVSDKHDDPMYVQVEIEPRRDFMFKFEEGVTKTPRGTHLAIPVAARAAKYMLVPAELRPKALGFELHTTKSGVEQWKGELRTFIIRLADGSPAIMQRTGPAKTDVRLLFAMKSSAPTPASLHFQDTARGTVIESIERNFPIFFEEAMRTAK